MPKHHESGSFGLEALKAGAIASAVAGGYKFAEFAVKLKKLHEVGSENAVFIRLIQRANLDLVETDRLLRLPEIKHALRNNPEKNAWIHDTVDALCAAMEQMGHYTERVGKDLEKGKHVGAAHRMRWVLDEYEKLMHRRMELSMCHQGLLQVLTFLTPLEPLKCCDRGVEVEVERQPTRWSSGTDELQQRYETQRRRRQEADDIFRVRQNGPAGIARIERRETTSRYQPGEERPGPGPRHEERVRVEYRGPPPSEPSEYGPMPKLRTHLPTSRL